MICPKCTEEMKPNKYKNIEYDQCRNCGGLWFDALEAEEMLEIKGAADIDNGDPALGAKYNKMRDVKCPACSTAMRPVRDIKQPHIKLEACPACHGTFFDSGEYKDFCEETFLDSIRDRFCRKD